MRLVGTWSLAGWGVGSESTRCAASSRIEQIFGNIVEGATGLAAHTLRTEHVLYLPH